MAMTEEVRKCVEILRYCEESGARCGGCPSGETNGIPNCHSQSHIADLIESLSAQLDQVTRERDAAKDINVPTQPKWISVKERLPEPFVSVLVHIPEEEPLPQVHEGYITPDGTWCSVLYVETYERVTHWMHLPEPPEGDE